MKRGRFFWKLFLGNAALVALVLGLSVGVIVVEFDRFRDADVVAFLHRQAVALRGVLESRWDAAGLDELNALVRQIADSGPGDLRITLVAADGTVLADSAADRRHMESHLDRPEIQQALRDGRGQSRRRSDTVRHDMQYVAVRAGPEDRPRGVVRVALPIRTIVSGAERVRRLVWLTGAVALAAAVTLALGLAILWSRRIARITAVARSLSRGDLTARVDAAGADEVAMLARSLNRMGDRLAGQLATIDRQRRTLESLLGQLTEGVIVARGDGRIVLLNTAATRLLQLPMSPADPAGTHKSLTVEQAFPQHDLQRLLLASSRSDDPLSSSGGAWFEEVRLETESADGGACLLARASDIMLPEAPAAGQPPGTDRTERGRLVVLTDITELNRAIRLRTDFVANASHELRTPLSAIRAAVETLLQMNLSEEASVAPRFLEMVARHVGRLEALVADLLDLSRVESPGARFEPVELGVPRLCDELHKRWVDAARLRSVEWTVDLAPQCTTVRANPHLLQLVLDNLVDNALKFTPSGGRVTLSVRRDPRGLVFQVSDTGCGIPADEHERVFERFYQVAPSRSGTGSVHDEPRGTGLGLSIVKHAVAAMNGSVHLDSTPGAGTRVTVVVPQESSRPG